MSSKLYLECFAGISGDMTVAVLLDLGADQKCLERALKSLAVSGFSTRISRVSKSGIDACDFAVILDKEHENHDHDMDYLHGTSKPGHDMAQTHEHHNQREQHSHEHHAHKHQGLEEILTIIRQADMTERAKGIAVRIFRILAEAEAKAHGVPPKEVHFHEVGAVDSIVDVVSAAVCFDSLGITEVIIPVLYEGSGYVNCQHGMMPVPVPAVANIVAEHGLILHMTEVQGEFVTPTGAAIAAAVSTSGKLPEHYRIEKIGIGAGKRNYERPSLLRGMLIAEEALEENALEGKMFEKETAKEDVIYKLESNIDDCTGEAFGYVMERLFAAGARDVFYFPVYMKKNRPAYQLNVICKKEDIHILEQIMFEETTTIGIRRQQMERSILPRKRKRTTTTFGEVDIKICTLPHGYGERCYPEYESVAEICRETKQSYQQVYRRIVAELEEME